MSLPLRQIRRTVGAHKETCWYTFSSFAVPTRMASTRKPLSVLSLAIARECRRFGLRTSLAIPAAALEIAWPSFGMLKAIRLRVAMLFTRQQTSFCNLERGERLRYRLHDGMQSCSARQGSQVQHLRQESCTDLPSTLPIGDIAVLAAVLIRPHSFPPHALRFRPSPAMPRGRVRIDGYRRECDSLRPAGEEMRRRESVGRLPERRKTMPALENMTAKQLEARLQVLAWKTPKSDERTAEIQRIVARLEKLPSPPPRRFSPPPRKCSCSCSCRTPSPRKASK